MWNGRVEGVQHCGEGSGRRAWEPTEHREDAGQHHDEDVAKHHMEQQLLVVPACSVARPSSTHRPTASAAAHRACRVVGASRHVSLAGRQDPSVAWSRLRRDAGLQIRDRVSTCVHSSACSLSWLPSSDEHGRKAVGDGMTVFERDRLEASDFEDGPIHVAGQRTADTFGPCAQVSAYCSETSVSATTSAIARRRCGRSSR